MATVKLTLSAEQSTVELAKRLARENGTSVSGLFTRLIRALNQHTGEADIPTGPLTREASGLARLPEGQSERETLERALAEKYGIPM